MRIKIRYSKGTRGTLGELARKGKEREREADRPRHTLKVRETMAGCNLRKTGRGDPRTKEEQIREGEKQRSQKTCRREKKSENSCAEGGSFKVRWEI